MLSSIGQEIYCVLQALGHPWPAAAGAPGPGGHSKWSNSELARNLISLWPRGPSHWLLVWLFEL